MQRNLIVTGLPRSGTTLLAALVDTAPGAVCLSEPPLATAKAQTDPDSLVAALRVEIAGLRSALGAGRPVQERRGPSGERLSNYLARSGPGATAHSVASTQAVSRPPLPSAFTLGLKSNALFLSALPRLAATVDLECFAVLRHPRATFASWLDAPMPIAQGHFAVGRWPAMARIAQASDLTLAEKFARIYDTAVRQVLSTPGATLLLYEDLTADPAKAFETMHLPRGDIDLVSRQEARPEDGTADRAVQRLRALGGPTSSLYEF